MMSENKTFFNPFFNGFHSSTLVQVIGNKSADLKKPDGAGPLDISTAIRHIIGCFAASSILTKN